MAIDLQKINLNKEKLIDLKKKANIAGSKAQVVLVLDYSGSMENLYLNGAVQRTAEKILPLGLAFDDNGEVDTYIFQNTATPISEPVTLQNVDGYVNKYIHNGKNKMGGTSYAPVLKKIFDKFKSGGSFLGFGKKKPMNYPVYIIFITDGDNGDKQETEEIIKEMSKHGFFIKFVPIGNDSFYFLDKLDDLGGRLIDNVNVLKVANIDTISDDALYAGAMIEYPEWLKQAENLNLIEKQ